MATAGMTMANDALFWIGRSVLVTGCTGFLGCWLVQSLCERGAHVVGLARHAVSDGSPFRLLELDGRVSFVQGQVENLSILQGMLSERKVGAVFHLAGAAQGAETRRDPLQTFETNVRGTWSVLEAVRRAERPIPVVVVSTWRVYANSDDVPYTEATAPCAVLPYEVSKLCAEQVAVSYQRTYGVPVGVARFSQVYGEGDLSADRLVPSTIRSIIRGEAPIVRSDSRVVTDLLYAADMQRACLLMAEAMGRQDVAGEVFNFAGERPVRVIEIVETILRLMARPDLRPRILAHSPDALPERTWLSLKAKERLGWSPQVPLQAGLGKTIAWHRRHSSKSPLT